jgi:hypothetical protein
MRSNPPGSKELSGTQRYAQFSLDLLKEGLSQAVAHF